MAHSRAPTIPGTRRRSPDMRILVLATKPLALRSGDGLRFVNIARQLRPRHSFELLCFAKPGQAIDGESAQVFERVTALPFPSEPPRSLSARVLSSLSPEHFMPESPKLKRALEDILAASACDLILDIGGLMLRNLPPVESSPPVVVDSIDEPGITFERALKHAALGEKPRLWRSLWLYSRINRQISSRARANVYASKLDADYYARRFPDARVASIPNGVDADFFHPSSDAPDPNTIAFEGNMAFEPNVDAAHYLCAEILPRLWVERPALRASLIGREPVESVRALASNRVTVTGTVADVREHLWRASIFVCPMRLGAGIKNKILQAWAMGLPIVATSQAMGGLEARDGENVLIGDDADSLAEAVSRLLASPELQNKLASSGRRLVLEKYTWKIQAERFERLFFEVTQSR